MDATTEPHYIVAWSWPDDTEQMRRFDSGAQASAFVDHLLVHGVETIGYERRPAHMRRRMWAAWLAAPISHNPVPDIEADEYRSLRSTGKKPLGWRRRNRRNVFTLEQAGLVAHDDGLPDPYRKNAPLDKTGPRFQADSSRTLPNIFRQDTGANVPMFCAAGGEAKYRSGVICVPCRKEGHRRAERQRTPGYPRTLVRWLDVVSMDSEPLDAWLARVSADADPPRRPDRVPACIRCGGPAHFGNRCYLHHRELAGRLDRSGPVGKPPGPVYLRPGEHIGSLTLARLHDWPTWLIHWHQWVVEGRFDPVPDDIADGWAELEAEQSSLEG
jgi:hypothetical protein